MADEERIFISESCHLITKVESVKRAFDATQTILACRCLAGRRHATRYGPMISICGGHMCRATWIGRGISWFGLCILLFGGLLFSPSPLHAQQSSSSIVSLKCKNPRREYLIEYDAAARHVSAKADGATTSYPVSNVNQTSDGYVVLGQIPNGPSYELTIRKEARVRYFIGPNNVQTDLCEPAQGGASDQIGQSLPGPASGGWYVVMGAGKYYCGPGSIVVRENCSETPQVPPRHCFAAIVSSSHAQDGQFRLGGGIYFIATVTKSFGPFIDQSIARQQLINAGWSELRGETPPFFVADSGC